ncbi:uncharacterized protein LOC131234535 [Magnolia sinica]|uniref:uncharacterized protein LOC131234535 n=1 Tax=Magnolia sinica TaxID=86752 RepID=UPI002658B6FA|nr:uncharacterized protein LOC131234535 [Magnolia sinica]
MDLRHRLERRRGRRTPEIENTQEIVAKNKDPWEKRFAELNDKFLALEKKQQPTSVPTAVQIQTATDVMMYRGFSITLTGSAWSWHRQLKPNSISSFTKLSWLFLTQFISGKRSRKPNTHLFAIKQELKESLKDYIARFNEKALKNPPKTLAELFVRAQKYTNAEEFSNARKNVQVTKSNGKGKRLRNEESQLSNKWPDDRAPRNRRPSRRLEEKHPRRKAAELARFVRADPDHQDKRKYCRFNRDHGHNTIDYVDLKGEIKTLIRKGHLRRYTKEGKTAQKEAREQQNNPPEEPAEIHTIFGGSSDEGDSNRARKAHSRKPD